MVYKLFLRQSFTEAGRVEVGVVQDVIQTVLDLDGRPHELHLLTGAQALGNDDFASQFTRESGLAFTPANFRRHRLRLLDQADAMLVVRTGLSESGAFEMAYNIFSGLKIPMFVAVWEQTPIRTTLLRDLQELVPAQYVTFREARQLSEPLRSFFSSLGPSR